jgi:hypothetical protein
MQSPNPPTQDDLHAYIVLIRFLRQVHSYMQGINDEAERFNKLLEGQCAVLNEHRLDIEDLTSALSAYEDEMKQVKNICPTTGPQGEGKRETNEA